MATPLPAQPDQMNHSWWQPILRWAIWTIVMSLIVGWLARSRLKARRNSDTRRLIHPPTTLIIGMSGFVFFAGLAILSNIFSNATTTWVTTTVFVGLALLSLPIL